MENEVNGFLTYDRQVIKIDEARVRAANQALINASTTRRRRSPCRSTRVPVAAGHHAPASPTGTSATTTASAYTEVVDANSSALLKQDATWRIVPGLADSRATRFESRNYPGAVPAPPGLPASSATPTTARRCSSADATWCAAAGLNGTGISLQLLQLPRQVPAPLQRRTVARLQRRPGRV